MQRCDTCQTARVSIHAPARGATFTINAKAKGISSFNPRAREGRDVKFPANALRNLVSIHAPARGATVGIPATSGAIMFQSTRPRGARQFSHLFRGQFHRFQSTRPRGARRELRKTSNPLTSFNPRAREGRDARCRSTFQEMAWFQSTRPRGARLRKANIVQGVQGFNPRAREGRDEPQGQISHEKMVSIHAPARGATALP